jgi:2-methylcitrate dehydratase PrpD
MASPIGLTQRLAQFTADITLEQIPASVIANAKLAILDCLGVAVLATQFELADKLFRLAKMESWQGPCHIWGSNLSASARDAAFVNASLAHALDYDDGGHVTTFILAASMAIAERDALSGAQLLTAFVAGREVRMSMDALFSNRFEGSGPGARGWHANGILGPIAAACAAGKLLRLNVEQMLNAIGLAAGSCGALGRDGGTMAKPLRAGQAAASGMTAALLARDGCSADHESLEGSHGLLSALGPLDQNTLDGLGQALGHEFEWEKKNVKVKIYSAAAATHAPVEAMLRLRARRSLQANDIETIECHLKPFPLLRLAPQSGDEGRFSMAYCLAVALAHGRLAPKDFSAQGFNDRRVSELMSKVHHHEDTKSIAIGLKSGEKLSEPIRAVGDLSSWDEVAQKFYQCTADSLSDSQHAAVVDAVARLESIDSVRPLAEGLQRRVT